jgi:hypothetical protein
MVEAFYCVVAVDRRDSALNGRLTSVPDVQSGPLVATPAETMAKAAGEAPARPWRLAGASVSDCDGAALAQGRCEACVRLRRPGASLTICRGPLMTARAREEQVKSRGGNV